MEKKIGSKEVKMGVVKGSDSNAQGAAAPEKLSYEQLNQACAELSQQNQSQAKYIQQLRQQMQQMNFALQTKRMDYLFKVIEHASKPAMAEYACFPSGFVSSCIAEIVESIAFAVEDQEEQKAE